MCTDSRGNTASIIAVIKTQGSDTKLVGQMQPYYEATSLHPAGLAGRPIAPVVTQIADRESDGVMMNEFPPKYFQVITESSGSPTPAVNITAYLEMLARLGIKDGDLPALQPVLQHRVRERFQPGGGPGRLAAVIGERIRPVQRGRRQLDRGSWTNDVSWVRGGTGTCWHRCSALARCSASTLFSEHLLAPGVPASDPRYRRALFHLLACETSSYRYWARAP